jgi:N-acetyl-anhydromuramyl-L-alanine amidase AmpD
LAHYCADRANRVSYHYTISEDAADHGVTVVDCVDTDCPSWSVGDANNRSINLCFAGSHASWSREQWLQQSRAIDVAAYLSVQDCKKYGIGLKIMPHGDYGPPPGVSDHYYVTDYIGWGSHTDVGSNFPWDVFTAAVNKYAGTAGKELPPSKGFMALTDDEQHELLNDVRWIKQQLGPNVWGPESSLGVNADGQELTLRDGLAAFLRKVNT